jgi:hypothetical protein
MRIGNLIATSIIFGVITMSFSSMASPLDEFL